MTRLPVVTLTKDLRRAVRGGHPWIFDRALARGRQALGPDIGPGDVVLIAYGDERVAVAFADPGRPIAARVLEADGDARIDDAWVAERARAAARCRVGDPRLASTDAIRVLHGENDYTPGLVMDLYGDTAVAVFDGPGAHGFWYPRLAAVLDGVAAAGLTVARVWARAKHAQSAHPRQGLGAIHGTAPPERIVIRERDARFAVDVRTGHKTGLFLDQRDNRHLVGQLAAGARVLDVCSYTGGFAVHAALGGAREVTAVDLARPAVLAAGENFTLSGLPAHQHRFVCADAFDFLATERERGERYDLVVVDPPSFAPSERAKPKALEAYRSLNSAALAVCEPGGWLMSASCSSHMTTDDSLAVVESAARTAGRRVRVLDIRGAAADHPVLPGFPEGRYLTFLVVAVE